MPKRHGFTGEGKETDTMKLSEGLIGGRYQIQKMQLPAAMEKHLEALGMTKGSVISVLNGKGRGILIIKIRGARFAVGRNITRNVEVKAV